MRYELTLLEKIIHEALAPENNPALTGEALKTALAAEQEHIKTSFQRILLSDKKEPLIERYIHYHYRILLRLSGDLQAAGSNLPEPGNWLNHCVEELMQFIELHFQRYLVPGGKTSMQDKVVTTLTIKELALMNRLLIRAGVFRSSNKMILTEFMIRHVVTLQTEIEAGRSVKNFYNGLFSSDMKTMDAVSSLLHRMLKQLEELRLKAIEKTKEERQIKKQKGDS